MEFNCRKTAKQIAKEFFLCVLVSNWELKANCVAIQLKFTFSPIFSRISSPQTPSPQTMCWRDGEEKVLWMRTKKKSSSNQMANRQIFRCQFFARTSRQWKIQFPFSFLFSFARLDLIVPHDFPMQHRLVGNSIAAVAIFQWLLLNFLLRLQLMAFN